MKKSIRTATIAILGILIFSAGSASAMFYGQSLETKAERIVEIADNVSQRVGDIIDFVSSNTTILEMIGTAGLTEEYEDNVTLYNEGLENVTNAYACLVAEDYEGAIANVTEALSIFREVYRSIHIILCNSDVKIGPQVDFDQLEEAIERSQEKVDDLKELISEDAPIYEKLVDAEGNLTKALELLPENPEGAKANLKEANILISEVYQYLKEVAQELNPKRIGDYCEEAYQYMKRFRERFGQAGTEGFDVDGFLQSYGYQNEEEFMARFKEMIENAQSAENVDEEALNDLEEIGWLIREMDGNLTQEMGRYRERHGQQEPGSVVGSESSGSGYGQEGSGSGYGQEGGSSGYGQNGGSYGGSGGFGQMGFGGDR